MVQESQASGCCDFWALADDHSRRQTGRDLQLSAAIALLEGSQLARWAPNGPGFVAVNRQEFEASWPKRMHPVFGRMMCWVLFSAGAELLAKGVCLACGIDIRELKDVPKYPDANVDDWAAAFLPDNTSGGTVTVPQFGTLRRLYQGENGRPAALKELCDQMHSPELVKR